MRTKTRVVIASRPGGPEVLQLVERPRPVPGEGEMLVRVCAAGMNRMDVMQPHRNVRIRRSVAPDTLQG